MLESEFTALWGTGYEERIGLHEWQHYKTSKVKFLAAAIHGSKRVRPGAFTFDPKKYEFFVLDIVSGYKIKVVIAPPLMNTPVTPLALVACVLGVRDPTRPMPCGAGDMSDG